MRKSPIQHTVKSHKRNGKQISGYTRGKGKHQQKRKNSRLVGKDDDGGGNKFEYYSVILIYDNDEAETIPIMAFDADDALNQALNERKHPDRKVTTSIVQDGLGDVVKKLIRGANKRYAETQIRVEEVKGRARHYAKAPQRLKKALLDEAQGGEVEALVKAGKSSNRFRAKAARDKLKQKYPTIYQSIAWNRV